MKKLYCYIDESGQDTKGKFFVVGIVILEKERNKLTQELKKIERESKKKNVKWHKSRQEYRKAYFEKILQSSLFKNTIFFETFANSSYYLKLTSYAAAKAVLNKAGKQLYTATIYIDGFNRKEVANFSKELRALHVKKRKVRGVRKEENNALIRLADAICGLVRDAEEEKTWALKILRQLQKKKSVIAL